MAGKYYTVEQISSMLKIHPKTIQRYIREGKLRANKVGKSWRINGHDLSVFIENEKSAYVLDDQNKILPIEDRIKVSAVVDIGVYDKDDAIHIIDMLTGALNSKPPEYGSSSMHTQHIMEENKIRITLWGGIRFMEVMISSISTLTEQTE
ncbi:MAG: helix-turn-helix domain-containing protein [Bacillota bacterium]